MAKLKDQKPLFPLKHEFYASLDRFVHEAEETPVMSTNLPEELRRRLAFGGHKDFEPAPDPLCVAAADEIDRLRELVACLIDNNPNAPLAATHRKRRS